MDDRADSIIRLPARLMLTAGASGSGKTLITCGLLQLLKEKGLKVSCFKCGPDYIDPMFHSAVLGVPSGNLDTFFTPGRTAASLFSAQAEGTDLAVLEGVMGYYDGLGGISTKASAYDVACTVDTPAVLIVPGSGTSVSAAAYVRGFLTFRENSRIRGVILNRISSGMYGRMKRVIQEETGVRVLGYVPEMTDCVLKSRHLGLVMPEEIPELKGRLHRLAAVMDETLDLPALLALAREAGPGIFAPSEEEKRQKTGSECTAFPRKAVKPGVRIGIARDEAFCFMYTANLAYLKDAGAEPVFFSPLHDEKLPPGLDGLILYGGYPELHAGDLSKNVSMLESVREHLMKGLPCLAECGGFLYLHRELEDMDGHFRPMVGVIPGKGFRTKRPVRFGYIELTADRPVFGVLPDQAVPSHEFHYYDSDCCGSAFTARKPLSEKSWSCIHVTENLLAGFPHLFYPACPQLAAAFLRKAGAHKNGTA